MVIEVILVPRAYDPSGLPQVASGGRPSVLLPLPAAAWLFLAKIKVIFQFIVPFVFCVSVKPVTEDYTPPMQAM